MDTSTKIAVAAIVTAVVVTSVILYFAFTIGSYGTIKTVGLKCDTTQVNWGILAPNDTAAAVIHVWSNGTAPVTNIVMTVGNWQPPAAADYLLITWNYDGTPVTAEPKEITLYLHVDPDITGIANFSNDITITAEG